jgi:YesN/AraC family two-component response regulator
MAQQLLAQNIPIDEVAKKVGFSSSRYFKKVFMKYTGQTP